MEDQTALFQRLARGYDDAIRKYQPTYDALLRLSTDLARVAAPGATRCLDFGTGTGAALPLLASSFEQVVAIEPGKPMLDIARERVSSYLVGSTNARISLLEGTIHSDDARALPAKSFDAVHCSLVLMFVPEDGGKLEVLDFFRRLLRPAGALVITEIVVAAEPEAEQRTFARWKEIMRHRGADEDFVAAAERQIHTTMHRRTTRQLRSLLEQAGFREIEEPFVALHTVMLLAKK